MAGLEGQEFNDVSVKAEAAAEVERWKHPGEACFVCDAVTADDNCYYWDLSDRKFLKQKSTDYEVLPICKPCFNKAVFDRSFDQLCINKFAARLNSQ